jgi:prevent-host-death family protein
MTTTTLTSRAFNQDVGKAKKAAEAGPVIITDRGEPKHVLLSIEEYRRLAQPRQTIGQLLSMPGVEDVDLESVLPQRGERPRPADFD